MDKKEIIGGFEKYNHGIEARHWSGFKKCNICNNDDLQRKS